MARNRQSAKAAGSRMERSVADYLKLTVSRFIDRAPKMGAKDEGDILHVESHEEPIAVEVKDVTKTQLSKWAGEAEIERQNKGAIAGVVVFKRHGVGAIEKQWVLMTLQDFAAILSGNRPPDAPGMISE